jgi:hypothetical protein
MNYFRHQGEIKITKQERNNSKVVKEGDFACTQ